MSGDARAGRGLSTTGLVVIFGLMAAGGGAAWTLLGTDEGRTEGVVRSDGETLPSPASEAAPVLALDLAPVASSALAGSPVLLRVQGRDASDAPASGRSLPAGAEIVLEGLDPAQVTVSAGFTVRGDRIVPAADLRLDEQGAALLAVHATAPGTGTLRALIDGREVGATTVAWTAPPERFVVLLPGQTLDERGEVRGVVHDVRAASTFPIEIVPVSGGHEVTFAAAYQATLTLGASAPRTMTVSGGRTTVTVRAPAAAGEARIEIQGLPAGDVRSTAFRVVPAEGN